MKNDVRVSQSIQKNTRVSHFFSYLLMSVLAVLFLFWSS